jgi:hypothetical protein
MGADRSSQLSSSQSIFSPGSNKFRQTEGQGWPWGNATTQSSNCLTLCCTQPQLGLDRVSQPWVALGDGSCNQTRKAP